MYLYGSTSQGEVTQTRPGLNSLHFQSGSGKLLLASREYPDGLGASRLEAIPALIAAACPREDNRNWRMFFTSYFFNAFALWFPGLFYGNQKARVLRRTEAGSGRTRALREFRYQLFLPFFLFLPLAFIFFFPSTVTSAVSFIFFGFFGFFVFNRFFQPETEPERGSGENSEGALPFTGPGRKLQGVLFHLRRSAHPGFSGQKPRHHGRCQRIFFTWLFFRSFFPGSERTIQSREAAINCLAAKVAGISGRVEDTSVSKSPCSRRHLFCKFCQFSRIFSGKYGLP